jgi:hypothetical protein
MLITIIICCISLPTMATDVISGKVVDSLSGSPLFSVSVNLVSPANVTTTDSSGNFKFTIITTGTKRIESKIGDIYYPSDQNVHYELFDLRGKTIPCNGLPNSAEIMRLKNISSGIFFLRRYSANQSAVYKFNSINSGAFKLEAMESSNGFALAKTAASSYSLNFQKSGYLSGTLTISGSASNIIKKMTPVSNSNTSKGSGTITFTPVDSLSVIVVIK